MKPLSSLAPLGSCHCGAVQLRVRQAPRSAVSCNCSICRRYGAVWAYFRWSSVSIEAGAASLVAYSWRRRTREYMRCKACGCVTHYVHRKSPQANPVGVNMNNFDPAILKRTRIRRLDGASTWTFLEAPGKPARPRAS